jgi:hypothetical protein
MSLKKLRKSIKSIKKRISRLYSKLPKRNTKKSRSKRCKKGMFLFRRILKSGKLSKRGTCIPLFLKSQKKSNCHTHKPRKHCIRNVCHYHPGKYHCGNDGKSRKIYKKPTLGECHCHPKRKHCDSKNECHYHPGKCHCNNFSNTSTKYYNSREYLEQPFNLSALGWKIKKSNKRSKSRRGSRKTKSIRKSKRSYKRSKRMRRF